MAHKYRNNEVHTYSFTFIIILLILNNVTSASPHLGKKFEMSEKLRVKVEAKPTLEYEDFCNPQELKFKNTIATATEQLKKAKAAPALAAPALKEIINAREQFLASNYRLCNENKLLACDQSTKRCSCGTRKSSLSPKQFTYDLNSHRQCIWKQNSRCHPTQVKYNPCDNGTKCVFTDSLRKKNIECDKVHIAKYEKTFQIITKCFCKHKLELIKHTLDEKDIIIISIAGLLLSLCMGLYKYCTTGQCPETTERRQSVASTDTQLSTTSA